MNTTTLATVQAKYCKSMAAVLEAAYRALMAASLAYAHPKFTRLPKVETV